jgi:hypothetical protein
MNSDSAEKIIHDGLIRFAKMATRASILIEGIIVSVDETNFTCVVSIQSTNTDGSTTNTNYNNVPLKVLIGSQASMIEIPTVNSNCTLMFRDNNIQRPQLYQVDQCDKILLQIGGTITLQIDSSGFIFNGGTLDGMVKVNSNVDRLNKIENDINTLKTAFSTWVVVPSDGGAALKTAAGTWFGTQLTKTVKADIENEKIKQ